MDINSIRLINFEQDRNSADIIVQMNDDIVYTARVKKIDVLIKQIQNSKLIHSKSNYIFVPNSLIVEEIDEDNLFEMVKHLIEDGDFYNVFTKI